MHDDSLFVTSQFFCNNFFFFLSSRCLQQYIQMLLLISVVTLALGQTRPPVYFQFCYNCPPNPLSGCSASWNAGFDVNGKAICYNITGKDINPFESLRVVQATGSAPPAYFIAGFKNTVCDPGVNRSGVSILIPEYGNGCVVNTCCVAGPVQLNNTLATAISFKDTLEIEEGKGKMKMF
jgi:hypothetical protein